MDKENSISTKVGRALGHIFAGCVATCLCACAIALTIRFIMWIF